MPDETVRISFDRLRAVRGDQPRAEQPHTEPLPASNGPVAPLASEASDDTEVHALQKPAWPRGLPMQPHHLEAQDAYHEQRTTFTLAVTLDQPWGVYDLDLNHEALQRGEVAIRRFEGIFPDGTPLALSGIGNTSALQRSFEGKLRDNASVDVFLGVVRQVPGKPLVDAPDGSTEPRRYARRVSTRPELESGQNPAAIPWLRPNVRILFEGEPVEDYAVLRIAQLVKGPNGRVVLTRKIVPPVLRVGASPVLRDILQRVHQRLVETRSALVAQRREGQEMTTSDAARVVLLMQLGRMIPRVADLLGPDVSPRDAYRALAEVVGALSAFGTEGTFTVLRYDVLQLGPLFTDLAAHIHQVLEAVTASRYREIPLTRRADGVRLADLHEPGLLAKELLLAIRGADAVRIRVEFPRLAKLAAMELLGPLLNAAANGISLIASSRPPGLAVPPQTVCFRLEQQGDQWEELVRRGTLAIYLPDDHRNAEITLFAKERGVLE